MAKRRTSVVVKGLVQIGHPFPYPLATPPEDHLNCDGSTFDPVLYPDLYVLYPSGKTPDLRAEFIRGWDGSRGVDSGRDLMSSQDHAYASHSHNVPAWDAYSDNVLTPNDKNGDKLLSTDNAVSGSSGNGADNAKYATKAAGSTETRPRNVAFNYIMRAR